MADGARAPHAIAASAARPGPEFRDLMPAPSAFRSFLEPGQSVIHPDHPEWGRGQVQSAVAHRVTVNFENQGKVLIDASVITLTLLS
ncbi:hypothetical protein AA13594_2145 [Gluconacetobacter azotocaptans DSM 13594]|nr:hypothetical protein AA13594_2145 [Gluconacetobacter azotocaptans DSM 13594]